MYETKGGLSPKNRLKRMQQGGGICPQILRISHEYHIKAFKIVKKNAREVDNFDDRLQPNNIDR